RVTGRGPRRRGPGPETGGDRGRGRDRPDRDRGRAGTGAGNRNRISEPDAGPGRGCRPRTRMPAPDADAGPWTGLRSATASSVADLPRLDPFAELGPPRSRVKLLHGPISIGSRSTPGPGRPRLHPRHPHLGFRDRWPNRHGATREQILADFSDRELEDVQQALEYAAWLTTEEVHWVQGSR